MATLVEQRSDVQSQLDALLAKDALSAEDRTECDRLDGEFEHLSAEIKGEEKLAADDAARRAKNAQRSAELGKGRGRKTEPATAQLSTTTIGNPREAWEEDPNKGFKTPREFLSCVYDAGRREPYGGKIDDRLKFLAAGSDEARGSSDPYGGFFVPVGFSPSLLKVDPEDDPTSGYTRKVPMENPVVKIPARTDKNHTTSVAGGLTVTRRPDTVALTSSQMTLEQVVLEAHSLFGLSYATEELLTDSAISFIALLEQGFSEQIQYQLVFEKLFGTGVGEFLGIMNSPALVTVAKETGQAPTTFVYENVIKMRAQCWGYGKSIWLANHDVLPQLMLFNQSVGTGGTAMIWQPSARDGEPDRLLGRPIFFTEYVKSLGTTGDVILANFNEFLEGTYQPMQSAESIHVRFINHERAFKFWLRNAGQPWWKTALTPQYSSKLLSPYVALAAR